MIDARRVGQTALSVPPMGLGTAPLGGLYGLIPQEKAQETVHYALERGVNFFDTAPLYGVSGERTSEARLGRALHGIPRDSYILATKVGRQETAAGETIIDIAPDSVLRSVEASLAHLQVDMIDILHIHEPEMQSVPAMARALEVLADLRRQGVIRAIGAGTNKWTIIPVLLELGGFDCFLLAGRYTLLEQEAHDALELCRAQGIGVFLGGVFNSGILATGAVSGAKYNYAETPPDVLERARRIEQVCAAYHVPLVAAALQFPRAHPAITSLIVGAKSPQEIAANLEALEEHIPEDFWQELQRRELLRPDVPIPGQPT